MRWSDWPPALRSPFAWLKPLRFEQRSLPVAVAQLFLARPKANAGIERVSGVLR